MEHTQIWRQFMDEHVAQKDFLLEQHRKMGSRLIGVSASNPKSH